MNWYQISNKAQETADIYLYSEIGGMDITAKDFVEDLKEVKGKKLNIHINSLGGSVFDGIAIYNAIKNFKGKVTTKVQGIGASIASVIALAGDEIEMSDNSLLMIHDPYAVAGGNAIEMRKTADLLDKIKDEIVGIYKKQTGLEEDVINKMMSEETWFNSSEALDNGFITNITEGVEVKNEYDLSNFKNITNDKVSEILNLNCKKMDNKENVLNVDEKTTKGFIAQMKSLLTSMNKEEVKEEEVKEEVTNEVQENKLEQTEVTNSIEDRLSKIENALTEIGKIEEVKEELVSAEETAKNEIEDLQNKVNELTAELEKAKAKNNATKVDTVAGKDPSPKGEEVVNDPNSAFFNKMAGLVKKMC